jgi:quercetin dioxygenase-like cupin family protein
MIHQLHIPTANSYGIQYTFSAIADGFPMHTHAPADAHDVLVITGSISLYVDGNKITAIAGQHLMFDCSKPHEIGALEANTTILNSFLHGMPEGYDTLPPEELEWTRESEPLTIK